MTTATVRFWPRRKFCAPTFTEYFSDFASSAMRSRVFSLTSGLWLSARDTVDTDTPANRAMSSICTLVGGVFVVCTVELGTSDGFIFSKNSSFFSAKTMHSFMLCIFRNLRAAPSRIKLSRCWHRAMNATNRRRQFTRTRKAKLDGHALCLACQEHC